MSLAVADEALEAVLLDCARLKATLSKSDSLRIRSEDERSLLTTFALTWFRGYRERILVVAGPDEIDPADARYKRLLKASAGAATRKAVLDEISALRKLHVALRSSVMTKPTAPPVATSDVARFHAANWRPRDAQNPRESLAGMYALHWGEC